MTLAIVRSLIRHVSVLAVSGRAAAQVPVRTDSARADSARVDELPEIKVTVTRTQEPLARRAVRGGRAGPARTSSAGSRPSASTRR